MSKKNLTNRPLGGKIEGKGWRCGSDGRIITPRGRLPCPRCNAPTIKLLPETRGEQIVVYCKKCHKESIVDIESVPVL